VSLIFPKTRELMSRSLGEELNKFIDDGGKGIKAFPEREPARFRGILNEMMGFEEDRL
jgi:hypothetical protein